MDRAVNFIFHSAKSQRRHFSTRSFRVKYVVCSPTKVVLNLIELLPSTVWRSFPSLTAKKYTTNLTNTLTNKWQITCIRLKITSVYFFPRGTVTNLAIWLVFSAVRIFLSLTTVTVTAGKSTGELVMFSYLREWTTGDRRSFPFYTGRLINGSLSLFTFK